MAAIVKFAAISIIAAALLAAACSGGDGSGNSAQHTPVDPGLLLAPGRTHLSLCVDGAGGFSVSDDEVDRVTGALESVLAAATDAPSEYQSPAVSEGCPPPAVLFGEKLDYIFRYSQGPTRFLESTNDASRHRIHVYVLPSVIYESTFGGDRYATTAEERICEGDVCNWVTQGLYVTTSTGSDVISRALRSVLVLNPPIPDPTEVLQFCLSGTPEEWCYQYNNCRVPTDTACIDYSENPTPTLPLEPTSGIDTSAWPTFSSPLGFDIKYPQGWTVDDFGSTDFPFQRVRIRNERSHREQDARSDESAHGFVPLSGEAWIDVLPNPLPYFDIEDLVSICGTEEQRDDGSSRAHETTVDGHRAVSCVQSSPSLIAEVVADSNVLWIEEPAGRAVHVGYTVHGRDPEIIAKANAALATITFHE